MKFIVNSKYLHAKVAEAIGKESTEFSTLDDSVFFKGDGGETEMTIHVLEKQAMSEPFLPAYWRDVIHFLKILPEQPITVELDYAKIDITCVCEFKISASL